MDGWAAALIASVSFWPPGYPFGYTAIRPGKVLHNNRYEYFGSLRSRDFIFNKVSLGPYFVIKPAVRSKKDLTFLSLVINILDAFEE
jgi:hypothetical protein